jgi:hypothetical protein
VKSCLLILAGIFLIASQADAGQPDCSQFKAFKGTVDHYYKVVRTDFRPAMNGMSNFPLAASCFLVRDLKQVSQKRLRTEQTDSVKSIWALRGLRYLTNCKDFRGRLIHEELLDPKGDRGEYLLRDGADKVPFFRTWMSHDTSVVAPAEVQQQIISEWQDWYASEAATFSFQQCASVNDWYF